MRGLVGALLLALGLCHAEEMSVKTPKGSVKGVRVDHDFGQYYYSFRGIRYAKAPVGKLRFKVRILSIRVFKTHRLSKLPKKNNI